MPSLDLGKVVGEGGAGVEEVDVVLHMTTLTVNTGTTSNSADIPEEPELDLKLYKVGGLCVAGFCESSFEAIGPTIPSGAQVIISGYHEITEVEKMVMLPVLAFVENPDASSAFWYVSGILEISEYGSVMITFNGVVSDGGAYKVQVRNIGGTNVSP